MAIDNATVALVVDTLKSFQIFFFPKYFVDSKWNTGLKRFFSF